MSENMTPEQIEEMLNAASNAQPEADAAPADIPSEEQFEEAVAAPMEDATEAIADDAPTGDVQPMGEPADAIAPPEGVDPLSSEEIDILGEIGNMVMGASATTMYTILDRKVNITTPHVHIFPTMRELLSEYNVPFIVVEVTYTEGVTGSNLLLLKTTDAAMITDIMLGGDGHVDLTDFELSELHLSAISEIMNQMVAAGATSLSEVLGMTVNISTPKAQLVDLAIEQSNLWDDPQEAVIKTVFQMEIEGLLTSELMQVMPYRFGKELVAKLLKRQGEEMVIAEEAKAQAVARAEAMVNAPPELAMQQQQQMMQPQMTMQPQQTMQPQVAVQPVSYQSFGDVPAAYPPGMPANLDMIIDVPLQVTVELGKTRRSIKEVLDFNIDSVIVLDKLAGELVEVVVNGKMIARGEVVVIDDNYGVRITEILAPRHRL